MRLGSAPISPSGRSFHHFLPELAESAVPSSSRRCELARWDLDCACMTKEQLVRHKAGGIVCAAGMCSVGCHVAVYEFQPVSCAMRQRGAAGHFWRAGLEHVRLPSECELLPR